MTKDGPEPGTKGTLWSFSLERYTGDVIEDAVEIEDMEPVIWSQCRTLFFPGLNPNADEGW